MNHHYWNHLTSPAWYALKDAVRARALGRCEWCARRPMALLHHRSYAHVGAEPLTDVMGVCHACHAVIHGHRPAGAVRVHPDALAARGDPGEGLPSLWLEYVQACETQQATAKLWHLDGVRLGVPQRAACGNPYAFGCTTVAAHVTCPACLQVLPPPHKESP